MKFLTYIFLFLTQSFSFAQQTDSISLTLVPSESSDCRTIYHVNGNYPITPTQSPDHGFPGTVYIDPSALYEKTQSLTFQSQQIDLHKLGSSELPEIAWKEISRHQVDSMILAFNTSGTYAFPIHLNSNDLWNHLQIVEYKDIINAPVQQASHNGIIDGVYLDPTRYLILVPFSERYAELQERTKTIRDSIRQSITPLLDSLLSPFYISTFEVSNKEYREFVRYASDSIELHTAYQNLNRTDRLKLLDCPNRIRKKLDPTPSWGNYYEYGLTKKYIDPFDSAYIEATKSLYHPQPTRFYQRRKKDPRLITYSINRTSIPIYPDTSAWKKQDPTYLSGMYFWHPAYDDYPVVNVSYEQMKAYCHWKTQQMNAYYVSKGMKTRVQIDLPSIAEYEMALKFTIPSSLIKDANDSPNDRFVKYHRSNNKFWYFSTVFGRIQDLGKIRSSAGAGNAESYFWHKGSQISSLALLNGNVSEMVRDDVTTEKCTFYKIETLSDDLEKRCFVLGSNYEMEVRSKLDANYNAIFYKQLLNQTDSNPTTGFRIVYRTTN